MIETAMDTIISVRGGAFEIETMLATAHEIANRNIKTTPVTPNANDRILRSARSEGKVTIRPEGKVRTIEQTAATRALHRKAPRLVMVLLCLTSGMSILQFDDFQ
jgi:hypothetical protein